MDRRVPPTTDTRDAEPAPRAAAARKPEVRDQVRAALDTPSKPAPAELRGALSAELGIDFGAVRLHTDEQAGRSALALGAAAYTVGRDIVFAPGAYAPHSDRGRQLIAHEAAHVAQQGAMDYCGGALEVDPPTSANEREAQGLSARHASREAEAVSASGTAGGGRAGRGARGTAHNGSVRVQRSLLGSLVGGGIGGIFGGVTLGLLGGLLGPAGAVIGAVVGGLGGLIGGAIVGDLATRRSRSLTRPERDYLFEIYRDSVDYTKVTITRNSVLAAGAARTTGNTVNLQDEHFKGDTMELSDAGVLVLAHEMGHVWQYQNGGLAYIPSSLIPQLVAAVTGGDRNAAYDWRSAARRGLPWHEWNAEQQAECISDYNEALRRINAGTGTPADFQTCALALPYIELVRQRIGAPGSSRRTPARNAPGGAVGAGGDA